MGVSYFEFWQLTPKVLLMISKAYEEQMSIAMDLVWLQGLYNQYAYASTQTNKIKYPREPFHRKRKTHDENGYITDEHAKELMHQYSAIFNAKLGGE